MAAIFVGGLLVRLPFARVDFHTSVDMANLRSWARAARDEGLTDVYTKTTAIYPPVTIYVLAGAAAIETRLPPRLHEGDGGLNALIKLPVLLADLLTAGIIALSLRGVRPAVRSLAAAMYVFNPGPWYVSAHWGQLDSIYTVFLVAAVAAMGRGAVLPTFIAYALAVGSKLQSVALAPLMIVVTGRRSGLRKLASGIVAVTLTGVVLLLPWLAAGRGREVLRATLRLPDHEPRISVTAYNLWYLLRLGQVHQVPATLHPAGLPLSYWQIALGTWGMFLLLMMGLLCRRPACSPALAAAALCLGQFVLAPHIRERYLLPVPALLLLAAADAGAWGIDGPARRGLWWAYGVISLTLAFNVLTIAPFSSALGGNLVVSQSPSAYVATLKVLSLVAAAANTAILGWLVLLTARRSRDATLEAQPEGRRHASGVNP